MDCYVYHWLFVLIDSDCGISLKLIFGISLTILFQTMMCLLPHKTWWIVLLNELFTFLYESCRFSKRIKNMKFIVFILIYFINCLPHICLANKSEGIEHHVILLKKLITRSILVSKTNPILCISQNYVPNFYVKTKGDVS